MSELSKSLNSKKSYSPNSGMPKSGQGLRNLLMVCVAALALLGVFKNFIQSKPTQIYVEVVAAGQDIHPGCKINFASLHYLSLPKKYASKDMFTSYEQLVGKIS